jgi:hypothetical protein
MASAALSTARDIVAGAIASRGAGWRNLADNVRAGGTPNTFIQIALDAVEDTLRRPRDEGEGDD